MNAKMYIITHKVTDIPELEGNVPLLVGAANNPNKELFTVRDCDGENISAKNKNYCELTGVYWLWKHSDVDAVGICHYRRFFTKAMISNDAKHYLTGSDMEKLLSRYEVIVPRKLYRARSIRDSLDNAPSPTDMAELEKTLGLLCPEYLPEYHMYMNGNQAFLYNMCVMRKEMFDSYCQWLFDILFHIEKNYDISMRNDYEARLFGFLSERLLHVWLLHNIPKDRIKQMRVVKTDVSEFRLAGQFVKNWMRNVKWIIRKTMGKE